MSDCTLAGFIFEVMKAEGFHFVGTRGRIGEEILTFKNEVGEIRTVEHGFTPVERKNFKISFPKSGVFHRSTMAEAQPLSLDAAPIITCKIDYSNRIDKQTMKKYKHNKKGGENG